MLYKQRKYIYEVVSTNGKYGIKMTSVDGKEHYLLVKKYDDFKTAFNDCNILRLGGVCEGAKIGKTKFVSYYGCNCCKDARDARIQPLIDHSQARFCIHNTCPYADEIEKAGGISKYIDESLPRNINIGLLFRNVMYWED